MLSKDSLFGDLYTLVLLWFLLLFFSSPLMSDELSLWFFQVSLW